jgi:hypothetical protein
VTRSPLALLAAIALLAAASCGGHGDSPPDGHVSYGEGRIFIKWQIAGAAPSDAECAGVDHLIVSLDNTITAVQISPVPCTLTQFRYDGLPEGSTLLRIDAVDGNGCRVSGGEARTYVSQYIPGAPSPTIALTAIQPCR